MIGGRVDGILEPSRAFGDLDMKKKNAAVRKHLVSSMHTCRLRLAIGSLNHISSRLNMDS